MSDPGLFERAAEAASAILAVAGRAPRVAVVLGSGLGEFADRLADPVVLPYTSIPHFPAATVPGHSGRLLVGEVGGAGVVVLQGRFHAYEGHDLATVTFPVRGVRAIGVTTLILTAATGGIREALDPGAIVCVSDHLNLLGANPLRGPNDDRLGPRFPDLSEVYSPRLRAIAVEEGRALGLPLPSGVYACMPGPSYETPAEIRMLRALGADVVGMSTVPEAIAARHAGMEVLALAVVSNRAAGLSPTPITHDEVLAAGRAAGPKLADLIERVVGKIAEDSPPRSPRKKENN